MNSVDFFGIMPMVLVFLGSLVPLTIKLLRGREQNALVTLVQGVSALFVAGAWAAIGARTTSSTLFSGALVLDGLSSISTVLICFISIISLILAYRNINTRGELFSEFVFVLMNSAIGMMMLVGANDLIILFIGLELMSLAIYVLIGISHEQHLSKEAAFKYFVLGSLAAAILLYGVSFIYGATSTTSLEVLRQSGPAVVQSRLFLMGWSLVLVGFLFKVAIVPFHAWTPDVYQGAPTPVTGFMATGVKLASFVALLRFITTKGVLEIDTAVTLLQWLAVATMLVGNIAAIQQESIKRMLAYSSIAHSGYLLMGVLVAGLGANPEGSSSVVFYLFSYTFMNLGAFAILGLFERYEESMISLSDLRGMASRYPGLAFLFSICLVSLAGIPPTAGFFGKFFIFSVAVSNGFYWMTAWAVLASVIGVYYYLRPIVNMYMSEGGSLEVENDLLGNWAAGLSAAMVVAIGIFAQPFIQKVQVSLMSLLTF